MPEAPARAPARKTTHSSLLAVLVPVLFSCKLLAADFLPLHASGELLTACDFWPIVIDQDSGLGAWGLGLRLWGLGRRM